MNEMSKAIDIKIFRTIIQIIDNSDKREQIKSIIIEIPRTPLNRLIHIGAGEPFLIDYLSWGES